MVIYMFDMHDVDKVASNLGITFEKFSKEDLLTGINIELEHGTVNECYQ